MNIKDANELIFKGSIALSDVEANGMRVDVEYLERTIKRSTNKIESLENRLQSDAIWKTWRRTFGNRASLGSRVQMGSILFGEMGYTSKSKTPTGRDKVDVTSLESIDIPFVKTWLKLEQLKKLLATNLLGVKRELVDGIIHPFFNLHLVRTFRSSSDSPNFQNFPIRDKFLGKLIRQCFIPRDGHVLVEIDYTALEVVIAACYHRDPVMIQYIKDPTKDMHRDMAAECYMLDTDEVSKEARFYAKNQFVFPQFYGDYYINCTKNLWGAMTREKLRTADGRKIQDVLNEKGGITERGKCTPTRKRMGVPNIPEPGSFEEHIKAVEENFWGQRFKVYAQWKKTWYKSYQKRGYFDTLTGFRIGGEMGRNDVINYPVQGSAFHCLLWSLIELNKWLQENKMRSLIVGQIHDSIVADVHVDELGDFLAKAKQVMTVDIRKEWDWITVPLGVEAEVTPEGGSWFDKKEVELK